MDKITSWITKTNEEISNRSSNSYSKEFDRFIQLYFLLNHILTESNDKNGRLIKSNKDSELIKEYLPKYIVKEFNSRLKGDPNFKEIASSIFLIMQQHVSKMIDLKYFANTGIGISKYRAFVEMSSIGYFNESESTAFRKTSMTKVDYEEHIKISNYSKYQQSDLKNLLEGTLSIIYAVRNNFYHGLKKIANEQNELREYINLAIIKVIKFVYDLDNKIYPNTWSFWDELIDIENKYTDNLKSKERMYETELEKKVKERVLNSYNKSIQDLSNWHSFIHESDSKNLSFAYYFITFERVCSIIKNATYKNELHNIVDALEHLKTRFNLQIDLTDIKASHNNCVAQRNNMFHGDDSIDLDTLLPDITDKLSNIHMKIEEIFNALNETD